MRRALAGTVAALLLVSGAAGAAVVGNRPGRPLPAPTTKSSITSAATPRDDSSLAAPLRSDGLRSDAGEAAPLRSDELRSDDGEDARRVHALMDLLDRRRQAVLTHDADRWLETVDPSSAAFRSAQAEVFANLRDVPFADWSYEYSGTAPAPSDERLRELGRSAWVARVLVGHRIKGFDTATSYSAQYLTLVHRGTRWFLASDTDGDSARQPWDLGQVRVVRGERVIVLGTASTSTLRDYARVGDRAVALVSDVWGTDWSRRAVLVAPRTQSEFGELLLREREGLGQIAAVTTGDLPSDGGSDSGVVPDGGAQGSSHNDRVVINPSAFARLGSVGRQVVLTHEMTHVAVRASTTAAVPIWLSEGFADYLGYRGTGISRATGAADVLALVRQGAGPGKLPTTADFDPTRTTIAPSYSAAWLACSLVSDTYGRQGLVALYRSAATGPRDAGLEPDAQRRLQDAFVSVLGVSEQRFTASWRDYLSRLAG